jgi:hypothetical protein
VPFPIKGRLAVKVVAPVPPFPTGRVPLTSDPRATLPEVITPEEFNLQTPADLRPEGSHLAVVPLKTTGASATEMSGLKAAIRNKNLKIFFLILIQ